MDWDSFYEAAWNQGIVGWQGDDYVVFDEAAFVALAESYGLPMAFIAAELRDMAVAA